VIKIGKEKLKHEIQGKCPWCNKKIITKVTERTLVAAVKAEKEVNYSIEKDTQKRLPDE